jgi:integrase
VASISVAFVVPAERIDREAAETRGQDKGESAESNHSRDRLARTVLDKAKEARIARSKHLPKRLTREEAAALLAQASRRYPTGIRNRALLRILYRCGLRSAEALELRPRDVNLPRREIRVNAGKGDKDRLVWAFAQLLPATPAPRTQSGPIDDLESAQLLRLWPTWHVRQRFMPT